MVVVHDYFCTFAAVFSHISIILITFQMTQNFKKYLFFIISLVCTVGVNAKDNSFTALSESNFFYADIPLGNATVSALFTITDEAKKEVMIGYDNFNEADVISPGTPGGDPTIGEGSYHTAIDKSSSGKLTIPSTITNGGITYTVTSIANHAFAECTNLTYISIPNTITDIDTYAFNNCTGLTGLEVDLTTPLEVTSSTFENSYSATLYVPKGCTKAYAMANYWKLFNAISEISGGATGLKGDVNLDGVVNIQDVVATISFMLNEDVDPFEEANADMNEDDTINITDVIAIINIILSQE